MSENISQFLEEQRLRILKEKQRMGLLEECSDAKVSFNFEFTALFQSIMGVKRLFMSFISDFIVMNNVTNILYKVTLQKEAKC